MSNENRIVLYTCKPERRSGQVVRVTPEAMDAINELVEQTDLSARSVASSLIVQAAKIAEIEEL